MCKPLSPKSSDTIFETLRFECQELVLKLQAYMGLQPQKAINRYQRNYNNIN